MNRREFAHRVTAAGAALAAGKAFAGPGVHHEGISQPKRVADAPVILEVAINGSTTKAKNRHAPETTSELAADTIRCFDAGATIVHMHSGKPNSDVKVAAQYYIDAFKPVRKKHPHGIMYPTANFDPKVYHKNRTVWPAKIQSGHYRAIAEAGLANMVLLDTGVVPLAVYDERGLPGPPEAFLWYGFWPEDVRIVVDLCDELGTGASISVFEPGWMKNAVAMARAGTMPRWSERQRPGRRRHEYRRGRCVRRERERSGRGCHQHKRRRPWRAKQNNLRRHRQRHGQGWSPRLCASRPVPIHAGRHGRPRPRPGPRRVRDQCRRDRGERAIG